MKFSHPAPILCKPFLYRFVYASRWSFAAALLLITYFVISPCSQALADEVPDGMPVEAPTNEIASDTNSDPVTVSTPLDAVVVAESLTDGNALPESGVAEIQPTTTLDEVVTEESEAPVLTDVLLTEINEATSSVVTNGEAPEPVTPGSETSISDAGSASGTSSADIPATVPETDSSQSDTSLPTNENQHSAAPATIATSTTLDIDEDMPDTDEDRLEMPTVPDNPPLIHETFSDAEVTFLKSDCVSVEGGSYYCQPRGAAAATRDALVAEPDADGDLEIFLVRDGEFLQLTHNTVDDAAPFYDGRSETMVWHRFIDDRYHIMEFDFEAGDERTLTDGAYTDMEPTRFGDRTVWQRWINGRWQVILFDGQEETQLTTADAHHLAPHIRGEVVLWQSISEDGTKQLESFDIFAGTHATIADSADATMTNPRLMMVYEAVYENGDVVTRGVDLKTGKISPLAALPVELPENLPEPDPTGETRALLTLKPSQKDDAVPVEIEPDESGLDLANATTATATSSAEAATSSNAMVLDLSSLIERQEFPADALIATTTDLVYLIPDLVIEPSATSTQNLE